MTSKKEWLRALEVFNGYRDSRKEKYNRLVNSLVEILEPHLYYNVEILFDFQNMEGRVLDVGCGKRSRYDFPKAEYMGIDPLEKDHKDLRVKRGVGEHLPFDKCSFDKVLCISVLQHTQSPSQVLDEIERVLIDGGMLFMSIYYDELGGYVTHSFNKKEIFKLFEKTNMDILHYFEHNKVGYVYAKKP
jgi:2-polyprenyl-3-methyl-5-hydroxy-6-metoxy-1,4-benzoquinol methylase